MPPRVDKVRIYSACADRAQSCFAGYWIWTTPLQNETGARIASVGIDVMERQGCPRTGSNAW